MFVSDLDDPHVVTVRWRDRAYLESYKHSKADYLSMTAIVAGVDVTAIGLMVEYTCPPLSLAEYNTQYSKLMKLNIAYLKRAHNQDKWAEGYIKELEKGKLMPIKTLTTAMTTIKRSFKHI